jgi:hypothetical protein
MSDHEKELRERELQDLWIEALLTGVNGGEDHTDRLSHALAQIEHQEIEGVPAPPAEHQTIWRLGGWSTVGVAGAVLLIFLSLLPNDSSHAAMEAIQRSLDVASDRVTRVYQLRRKYRDASGDTIENESELYVRGNDCFALRHPGVLPGATVWLGKNGNETWIVPAFGPPLTGDSTILEKFLGGRAELDTPYLNISSILTRMKSRGFELDYLPPEEISGQSGKTFTCNRIVAYRNGTGTDNLPISIKLWTDRDSEIAMRIAAQWKVTDQESGVKSIELEFQDEAPSLLEDWFTTEAHR